MKIVVLDGYAENPGDLSWDPLRTFGEVTVYDRVSYEESPAIAEAIGDGEIVLTNKTPVSKATIDRCPNIRMITVLAAKNCIITPHISWAAKESRQRIMDVTAGNIRAFLDGAPVNVVNGV